MTPTVNTNTAMRFAGASASRFNENYSRGYYACAPVGVVGEGRAWGRDDLVVLKLYAEDIKAGVLPKIAGRWACELRARMDLDPGIDVFYRDRTVVAEGGLFSSTEAIVSDSELTVHSRAVVIYRWETIELSELRRKAQIAIDAEAEVTPRREDLREAQTKAARDVLAERARQISVEGWTPERDNQYAKGELAEAGACYALLAGKGATASELDQPGLWPWHWTWWRSTTRRRDLVKAGALIIAELERLDRAAGKDAA
jgi:hypothetical protein